MSLSDWSVFHLRVTAEPDPGALARVLERFQNLNIVPRRVSAQCGATGLLFVEVEAAGLSEESITLIAAKLGQVPSILNAYWYR
jgi:hypothetical protein